MVETGKAQCGFRVLYKTICINANKRTLAVVEVKKEVVDLIYFSAGMPTAALSTLPWVSVLLKISLSVPHWSL